MEYIIMASIAALALWLYIKNLNREAYLSEVLLRCVGLEEELKGIKTAISYSDKKVSEDESGRKTIVDINQTTRKPIIQPRMPTHFSKRKSSNKEPLKEVVRAGVVKDFEEAITGMIKTNEGRLRASIRPPIRHSQSRVSSSSGRGSRSSSSSSSSYYGSDSSSDCSSSSNDSSSSSCSGGD